MRHHDSWIVHTNVPPPPLSKHRLCPSNTGRWFRQFLRSVDFGGAFFTPFYCVPCVLPDTLVLRCTMFIFCVKAALLAKRAFVACFASWFSEWYTMSWIKPGWPLYYARSTGAESHSVVIGPSPRGAVYLAIAY